MEIVRSECKAAVHYSVGACPEYDCIYFEGTNPFGNRSYCRAYKKWVSEVTKCDRCMDKNHPYPNPYYQ